ncbi:MAG: hypothetical protein WC110_10110 [Bacteroidales bacterium]
MRVPVSPELEFGSTDGFERPRRTGSEDTGLAVVVHDRAWIANQIHAIGYGSRFEDEFRLTDGIKGPCWTCWKHGGLPPVIHDGVRVVDDCCLCYRQRQKSRCQD